MVPYRAMLDVPHEVVEHVSWLIYARRRELDSPWGKLGCSRQALLVLVYLRKNETLAQLGAGFEVSTATAGRYVTETVDVLAEHAPGLVDALHDQDPHEFLVMDATLVRTDPVAADEPYYSMKHRHHGMNVQVLARPDGTPIWCSRALPGRTHDLTAARAHAVVQACLTRQILVLADRAYREADATPPSAPRTTAMSCLRSTRSSTAITPVYELPANTPSRASSNGGSSARRAAAPPESAAPSPPFTPKRSPGTQDEKRSLFHPVSQG